MARPMPRPSTPNDLEMTDPTLSPIPSPRQPLPTSLASFALAHSTSAPSSPSGSSSIMAIDREDFGWPPLYPPTPSFPAIRKLRRSSLLSSRPAERPDHVSSPTRSARSGSPINTVFPSWKDEEDSPIVASPTDSSPPDAEEDRDADPHKSEEGGLQIQTDRKTRVREMNLDSYRLSISPPSPMVDKSSDPPTTPRPMRLEPAFVPSPPSSKPIDVPKPTQVRVQPLQYNNYAPEDSQLSSFQPYQLKPARLMAVLHESNAQETELQSEASFQRLVASHAELPLAFHPRTPRSARGRFPEEVGGDDDDRRKDDNDSDDDEDVVLGGQSGEGSVVDDSRWGSDSPAMDIEMASSSGSPSIASSVMHSQFSTPQPASATPQSLGSMSWRDNQFGVASSSGRAAKRKHVSDERFDPYAYPTKRRAVSPAVTLSSTSSANSAASHPLLHSLSSSPMSIVPRSPISQAMSPYSANSTPRGNGDAGRSVHSSPILRPVHRLPTQAREREERERAKQVNGAGEGVRGINLSS